MRRPIAHGPVWKCSCGLLAIAVSGILLGTSSAPPTKAAAERIFVTALSGDPPTVNPDITTGALDQIVGCTVYQSLVRFDTGYRASPNLAKSWTISPDGRTYTFHLVDAKWQDGQPLTSADVKYTFLNVSKQYGAAFRAAGADIQSIDTPDPHTVKVTLNRPFGPFLYSLICDNNGAILPEHVFSGTKVLDNPASLTHPVGTGPFKLSEWVRGDHLTLVRNPDYWRLGFPKVDKVVFKIIPDPSSRVLALESGDIDYIEEYYFPGASLASVKANPKFQEHPHGGTGEELIILNNRHRPLNDRRVRQALLTAIDRNFILRAVFPGIGDVAKSAIDSSLTWAYDPKVDYQKMYPYDPARAKKLLDEAGVKVRPDGWRFTMHLVFDSGKPGYASYAQAVQRYWQAVGVRVVLDGAERQVELKRVYLDLNFDATIQDYSVDGDPALGIARTYISSAIQKRFFVNASGYSNPEVDSLFEKGAVAPTQAERGTYYRQLQVILARDLPSLNIVEKRAVDVASKRVAVGLWVGQGYDYWDAVSVAP